MFDHISALLCYADSEQRANNDRANNGNTLFDDSSGFHPVDSQLNM